jgi:hypothetical protein
MNRAQLKTRHQELNSSQPFTKKESEIYNKKDQSMIRNIQILNNYDKKTAIKAIKAYKASPKETLKALGKEYRKRLDKYSSPKTPEIRGEIPPHGKKQAKQVGNILRENRKLTNAYLKNPKNRNTTNYKRIEKASKKYIDASPHELKYGVNSKESQNYRERIGLNIQYQGRIIK